MKNSKMFDNLRAAVEKAKNGTPAQNNDEFWKAETDKAGNGYAVIRFLPGKTDDHDMFVKTYSHGFKGDTGKWFIEDCPTTVGQDCPCCKENGVLWNSGIESDKKIVRDRKRRVGYIANVLVISDPKNPDNEGKVFKFKFGQKIFDKIADRINPQFEDEDPLNPFDLDEGANFKLKIRKVEGYANFDKSEFEAPSKVDNQKEVMAAVHDLSGYIDPKNFKSYEELEKKFLAVISDNNRRVSQRMRDDEDEDEDLLKPKTQKKTSSEDDVPWEEPKKSKQTASSDDDDDEDYFRRLAEED